MRAFFKGAILAASASLIVACGGGDPITKALGHQDKVVSILESNKDNPEKAGEELEKYIAANKADLDALKAESSKMEETFKADPAAAMELIAKHAETIQKLETRKSAVTTANPALMENAKVQAAMSALGGGL